MTSLTNTTHSYSEETKNESDTLSGSTGVSEQEIEIIYACVCNVHTTDTNQLYTKDDVKFIVSIHEGPANTMVECVINRMLDGLHMTTLRQMDQPAQENEWTCGNWKCTKCTFLNAQFAEACHVCYVPRKDDHNTLSNETLAENPSEGSGATQLAMKCSAGIWECRDCTFDNHIDNLNCRACTVSRP